MRSDAVRDKLRAVWLDPLSLDPTRQSARVTRNVAERLAEVARALDPAERHALGAHYTPRAYVERLVLPTIVEPLREDWKNAQAAALVLAGEGNLKEAQQQLRDFLKHLCEVRVLDPA